MTLNYEEFFSVVLKSLKEAFQWKIWKWLVTGSLGTILGILKIGKDFFKFEVQRSVIFAVIALLILYFLRFILLLGKNSIKYFHEKYRNSLYGEAIIILKDSFAHAHLYRKTPGHQDTEFMSAMIQFCNNLKIIFDKITDSNCCVSIKVPLKDIKVDEKTVLVNLCRNIEHKNRDTKEYMDTIHTLIGNTAFSSSFNKVLHNKKERFYVNDDVSSSPNYDNSSKACNNGVLPYKSELVHPIVPIINVDNKNINCHGFICIDSDKQEAFKTKYDFAILEGVADGIYDLISDRNQIKL
ncbi:hypothetical protein ACFGVS_21625 [Mucilaginibacter sp. AW1-7]|uniref:hypothetical protein n=1 Tax=Mucilaginibacter sp. AW1-7 TaxID=3349874 RepID=UPI003F739BED